MAPLDVHRSKVDAVLLDVGGVLVLPRPDRVIGALEARDLTPPVDLETYRRSHYQGALAYDRSDDRPETWPAYHVGYAEALGFEEDDQVEVLAALEAAWSRPGTWAWRQEDAIRALDQLVELGLGLGIVSNSDGTVEAMLREQSICQVGPGEHVEMAAIVDSAVVGHDKPDPAAFAPAIEALGVAPERILFVGDTVRNDVRGAEAAGLLVAHLDPFELHPDADHWRVTDLHQVADALSR